MNQVSVSYQAKHGLRTSNLKGDRWSFYLCCGERIQQVNKWLSMLNEQDIKEFKAIYHKETWLVLSDEDAKKWWEHVINIIKTLIEHWYDINI